MKQVLLKVGSFVGLGLVLVPSILVFLQRMDLAQSKSLMGIGTLMWFLFSVGWINKGR